MGRRKNEAAYSRTIQMEHPLFLCWSAYMEMVSTRWMQLNNGHVRFNRVGLPLFHWHLISSFVVNTGGTTMMKTSPLYYPMFNPSAVNTRVACAELLWSGFSKGGEVAMYLALRGALGHKVFLTIGAGGYLHMEPEQCDLSLKQPHPKCVGS